MKISEENTLNHLSIPGSIEIKKLSSNIKEWSKATSENPSIIVQSSVPESAHPYIPRESALKQQQTALRKRNEVRDIYLKLPFPLDFRVNFFNVTNPDEVMNGAKPILQEVGPYCYDEWKQKIDVEENNNEDSLTYTQYDVFHFNAEKSGNLRDDDYVTILHPLIIGMANTVEKDTPALLSVVNKALNPIFNNPKSIYLRTRVKDVLFDGVKVYCNSKDFASKAVCTQLKTQIPGIKSSNEKKVYLFSLLGPRNATNQHRFKVLKGINQSKDLGRLMEVNGQRQMTIWGSDACNRYQGTDGWIFPPGLSKEEGIKSYSSDVCRSLTAYYVEDTVYKGVNVRRYHADLGDQSRNEDEKCYCPSPKNCMKKGIFDLSKCMGVPIVGTLPHFLMVDESIAQQVSGLNPRINDHIIKIHFEPMTGTPIEAQKRLQFNLFVHPVKRIDLLKNISSCLHPLFWVQEGVDLNGKLLKKVTDIFLLINILSGFKYVGMAAGAAAGGVGAYLHMKNRNGFNVTSPTSVNETNNNEEVDEDDIDIGKSKMSSKDNQTIVKHIMSEQPLEKY